MFTGRHIRAWHVGTCPFVRSVILNLVEEVAISRRLGHRAWRSESGKMERHTDKAEPRQARVQQHFRTAIAVRILPANRGAPPHNPKSKNEQANPVPNPDTTTLKENQTLAPTRPSRRHCTTRPPGTFHHPANVYSVEPDNIL